MTITYRNARGVEGYYTYQTAGLGRGGTVYIGDYTNELTVVRPDITTNSIVMPFQISHVYNTAYGNRCFTGGGDLHTRDYSNMRIGNGWKLNIQQTVVEQTISGREYLIYSDADGTEHYFPKESDNTYKDEDGLRLTVTKSTDPLTYTMTDEQGNQKIFINGYLTSLLDANGNAIHLLYNGGEYSASGAWHPTDGSGNKITKVVELDSGETQPKVIAQLSYDGAYLSSMEDTAGRTTAFTYTAAYADANGHLNGQDLTRITDPDGKYVSYGYYSPTSEYVKAERLARTRDSETMQGCRFTYRFTNFTSKVSGFSEILWSNSTDYTEGHKVDVVSSERMQTLYKDHGLDCSENTSDDIWTYCTFDNAGRTISQTSTDRSGTRHYGAASTVYGGEGKSANKVLSDVAIGANGVNQLRDGGAESGGLGWTAQTGCSSAGGVGSNIGSASQTHTGENAFQLHVTSAAQPDESDRLYGSFSTQVTLKAGRTYTFSGYFKNTTAAAFGNKSQVYLQVTDASGSRIAMSSVVATCTDERIENGWTRLTCTFTVTSDGTYTLMAAAKWVRDHSYFDDLQLEENSAPSSPNLLWNGDAEWADGWTFSSGASRQENDFLHGDHAIRIYGKPDSKRTASINIPLNLSAENTFVLSGWAQADCVAGIDKESSDHRAFGLEAVLNYSDNTTETHYVSFDESTSLPQYVSGNIVPKEADKTISSVDIRCVYGKNANTAWFDNLSFRKEPIACYTYDSDGNVVAVNAAAQDELTFAYQSGDLIQETDPASGVYTYTYDSRHNLTRAVNDGVQMRLNYDVMGRVTSSVVSSVDDPTGLRICTEAEYTDSLRTYTDATGATVKYGLNGLGLVTAMRDPRNYKTSYVYDGDNDRLTKVSLDDGTSVSYTYSRGTLYSMVRHSLLPDGTTADQTYGFTLDSYGNVTVVKVGGQDSCHLHLHGEKRTADQGDLRQRLHR